MSQTIKILPQTLADKIAAGEVVQRPAAAVKELIENSIDAQARSITVIIKEGGKSVIQVIDDGLGMSPEDASLAFARHATSKISTYEDLENIRTLGFRGEALASIAAVSLVEMRSRQALVDVGTSVRIEGGVVLEISEVASAPGTSVVVRNLFFNTPGRRNFLKAHNTEYKHIYDVIQRIAISHPDLSIRFVSDDEEILQLRPSSSQERMRELFGEKIEQSLFAFREETELATITGFLGKPEFARKGRTEQFLFLNNRYIINRSISHAVFQAYENLLEKGSFPVFVVFLKIDPHNVDVNVHPSKMEVKFADESSMYRFILTSVRKALSAHDLVPFVGIRELSSSTKRPSMQFAMRSGSSSDRTRNWGDLLKKTDSSLATTFPMNVETPAAANRSLKQLDTIFTNEVSTGQPIDRSEPPTAPGWSPSLWQVHSKYIIVQMQDGLMIVDQHAAHERVLYERAVARFNETNTKSQQLLFPYTLQFTVGDVALIQQLLPYLESLGFSLKLFGKGTVIVDGVPIDVRPGDEGKILQELLDLYKEDDHNPKLEPREKLAKSFSCKAAIKAGDPLKDAELRSLLDQLFATEIPYSCPHGRPVIIKLSLSELDRRFGRTS